MPAALRSERVAAAILLLAAVAGLITANTAAGPPLARLLAWRTPSLGIGLDLSVSHWISDALLGVFFCLIAIDLRHEVTAGELTGLRRALVPAVAAVGGVLTPALVYLAITAGSGTENGWPVPTATDVAFALGVLAMFGRGLPASVRAFLLALAVLDDLIAIVIIAFVFPHGIDLVALAGAGACLVAFWALARTDRWDRRRLLPVLLALAALTWWCVLLSGVHATIAAVALGLVMPPDAGRAVSLRLDGWSKAVVLPVFAFTSSAVVVGPVSPGDLSRAFWAILVALPVGKFVGITAFGWAASRLGSGRDRLPFASLATVGALGGIGFTVSLLMTRLAFAGDERLLGETTLAVLLGSGTSMVIAAVVVTATARRLRGRAGRPSAPR